MAENDFPFEKTMMAFTIGKDSVSNEIEISGKEGLEHIKKAIMESKKLVVASSNQECVPLSVDDNIIITDKIVKSANSDKLLKGEIIIIYND